MITAILYLSILLAERINTGKGLRDRPGGYVGETENVEIFKCPRRKRTGATQKAELLVGVERENSIEDAKKFGVLLWCLSDRVVIRHPKYLMSWMPQQGNKEGNAVQYPKKLLTNSRSDRPVTSFL